MRTRLKDFYQARLHCFRTFWLARSRYGWWVGAAIPLLTTAFFFYDRSPPFMVKPGYAAPSARAGEEVRFVIPVDRDLGQACSLTISRYIKDANGSIRTVEDNSRVTAEGIRQRDNSDPDFLKLTVRLPQSLPSGLSHLLTEASYICARNPTTWVLPLEMSFDWPFTVLPPLQATSIVIVTPLEK